MAIQTATGSRSNQMDSKVAVGNGKKMLVKSQPISGKLSGDMNSMPGSKGKGQGVTTVPSNPISGAPKTGTAMGSGGVINGMV